MSEQYFTSLKGINIKTGLEYAEQNSSLYSRLLLLFLQSQSDFNIQFDDAIKTADFQVMYDLVHAMKGAAGVVGASDLQASAQQLESLCLKKQLDRHLINLVVIELDKVLSGIEQFKYSM